MVGSRVICGGVLNCRNDRKVEASVSLSCSMLIEDYGRLHGTVFESDHNLAVVVTGSLIIR